MDHESVEVPLWEAERISYADRVAARGDAWAALVCAIQDALSDIAEAERRTERVERHVSRVSVRECFERPGQ